jgi:hypothetical protein
MFSGDMARSPKSRVGKGLKGQAKRAVRDRLNAIAASERNVEHKLAVAQKQQFKEDAMATLKSKERQARASPAESTRGVHNVRCAQRFGG